MIARPENMNLIEWPSATSWFDRQTGIFYSISKKAPAITLEEIKRSVEEFRQLTQGKKVCMLLDVTDSSGSSREVLDYTAQALPGFVKAIAVVSASVFGKMLVNLFFTLRKQPYPIKIFNTENDAREWLTQYL